MPRFFYSFEFGKRSGHIMGLLTTIATFKANKCMDEEFGSLFLRNLPSGEFSADETNAKASLKYALRIFELGRRLISLSSI